jgi:hypothetical protein
MIRIPSERGTGAAADIDDRVRQRRLLQALDNDHRQLELARAWDVEVPWNAYCAATQAWTNLQRYIGQVAGHLLEHWLE